MTLSRSALMMAVAPMTLLLASPEASTQEAERLERLPPRVDGGARKDLRGVRIARPGALLLASFDADGSMSISRSELDSGAGRAFAVADTNEDGRLSIFEQQDWAARTGSHDGPLANATTFDTNFDRQVSEAEFVAGIHRLASPMLADATSELMFADLLEAPAGASAVDTTPQQDVRRTPSKPDRFGAD